jgi:hypothetical protein
MNLDQTPINLLEHHHEVLMHELSQTEKDNFFMRNALNGMIRKFDFAILELKNIEIKK